MQIASDYSVYSTKLDSLRAVVFEILVMERNRSLQNKMLQYDWIARIIDHPKKPQFVVVYLQRPRKEKAIFGIVIPDGEANCQLWVPTPSRMIPWKMHNLPLSSVTQD